MIDLNGAVGRAMAVRCSCYAGFRPCRLRTVPIPRPPLSSVAPVICKPHVQNPLIFRLAQRATRGGDSGRQWSTTQGVPSTLRVAVILTSSVLCRELFFLQTAASRTEPSNASNCSSQPSNIVRSLSFPFHGRRHWRWSTWACLARPHRWLMNAIKSVRVAWASQPSSGCICKLDLCRAALAHKFRGCTYKTGQWHLYAAFRGSGDSDAKRGVLQLVFVADHLGRD